MHKGLAIFALMFASAAVAQDGPGMYLDRGGELVKMEHASLSGAASKGVAKSVFVPGAMPSGVWEYRGAESVNRVGKSPKFVYLLREGQTVADQDLVIVRMDQKSDRREIRVAKQSAWTANVRTGFDKAKLIELKVTRKAHFIEIEPVAPLAAGEYFVTSGFSPVGFDFGVSK